MEYRVYLNRIFKFLSFWKWTTRMIEDTQYKSVIINFTSILAVASSRSISLKCAFSLILPMVRIKDEGKATRRVPCHRKMKIMVETALWSNRIGRLSSRIISHNDNITEVCRRATGCTLFRNRIHLRVDFFVESCKSVTQWIAGIDGEVGIRMMK